MTRAFLMTAIGALSFTAAACGDYDEESYNNAAYDAGNATYDEGNASYESNTSYNEAGNDSDYAPPTDGNDMDNIMDGDPTNNMTNSY